MHRYTHIGYVGIPEAETSADLILFAFYTHPPHTPALPGPKDHRVVVCCVILYLVVQSEIIPEHIVGIL